MAPLRHRCGTQLSGDEVAILDAAEALDDLGMSPGNQAGSPLSKPSAASVCLCAVLHLGSGLLKDGPAGRLVAELKRDGTLLSAMGSGLGCFRPFSFKDAKAAALYLALLDPGPPSFCFEKKKRLNSRRKQNWGAREGGWLLCR